MKTLEELKILPKKGEYVTSVPANKAPTSNNSEINLLNTKIGNIGILRDVKYDDFDFENVEKDILQETVNIVNKVNIDKIDIGNKNQLNTKKKNNLVNSINEIQESLYLPSRLEDILARYSDNRRGDFIHSGLNLSYDVAVNVVKDYPTYLYETIQKDVNFSRWEWLEDKSKWSKVKYIKELKKTKYSSIQDTETEISFSLTPGKAYIDGYKVDVDTTLSIKLPDTLETDEDLKHISDNLFLVGGFGGETVEKLGSTTHEVHQYDVYDSFYVVTEEFIEVDFIEEGFFYDSLTQPGELVTNYPSEIDSLEATNCYIEPPLQINITGQEESYVKVGNVHYIDLDIFLNLYHGVNIDFSQMTSAIPFFVQYPIPFDHNEYNSINLSELSNRNCFIYTIQNGYRWFIMEIVYTGGKWKIKIDEDHPLKNSSFGFELNSEYIMSIDEGYLIKIDKVITSNISDFGMNLRKSDSTLIKSVEHFFIGFETIELVDVVSTYPREDYVFLESRKTTHENEYGWNPHEDYKKSEIVYYNEKLYMAKVDIDSTVTTPEANSNWGFVSDVTNDYFQLDLLRYIEGSTSVDSSGNFLFDQVNYNGRGLLMAVVQRSIGTDPIITPNINARLYSMKDLKTLEDLTRLNQYNVARLNLINDISNSGVNELTLSRDLYTDNFEGDSFRDFNLERESGLPSLTVIDNHIEPRIMWDSVEYEIEPNIQLSTSGETPLIKQIHYTGSDLINEYEVSTPSALFFDMNPKEHTFLYEEYTDVKNETISTGEDQYGWMGGGGRASIDKTETNDTITDTFITKLQQNGTRPLVGVLTRTISLPIYTFGANEKVNVTIGEHKIISGISTSRGAFETSFTLNGSMWRDTNYKVLIKGETSGSEAISTLSIFAQRKTIEVDRQTLNYKYIYTYDPIAQTFLCEEDCFISSLEVIFNLQNPSGNIYNDGETFLLPENVTLCVSETTAGLPDHEKIFYTQNIPIGIEVNNIDFYKIDFNKNIKINKDSVYAFFFLAPAKANKKYVSGDPIENYEGTRIMLRSVQLDKKTPYTPVKLINEQPYIEGVLLKSSNAVTWTEFQDKDLTFKLNKASYSDSSELLLDLDPKTLSKSYTDMFLRYESETPDGSYIQSNILLKDEVGDQIETFEIINGRETKFPSTFIEDTEVSFALGTTNPNVTPTLEGSLVGFFGNVAEESVYITKNISFNYSGSLVNKNLRVLLDSFEDMDISKIKVYYNTNGVITEGNWTEITELVEAEVANEFIWSASNINIFKNFRIKISLFTDNSTTNRIKMKNLRVLLN